MEKAALPMEITALSPATEIGAFEALWQHDVHSYKQLRDKLETAKANFLSELVSDAIAKDFYQLAKDKLSAAGINDFGAIFEGTLDYPQRLYDADYPLVLLYYIGNLDLLFTRGVAVVGTRNPSENGIKRTHQLVKALVEEGFTIYSGLATGIDTAAHNAAINNSGKTVAVIGTPLWVPYPPQNKLLQDRIAKEHLLISQVPLVSYKQESQSRMFFPERNKTMSALSEATIIVEAGESSGTLIQAKAGLKQGRKVFILNSNFENPNITWPSKLQEQGAIRVSCIEDILRELNDNSSPSAANR